MRTFPEGLLFRPGFHILWVYANAARVYPNAFAAATAIINGSGLIATSTLTKSLEGPAFALSAPSASQTTTS